VTPRHEPIERLHRDLGRLGEEVSRLRVQMQRVQQRTDQVLALRQSAPDAARRLAQLESVLDAEGVAAHLRDAIARAPLQPVPVPHLSVGNVLPAAVYDSLVDAIPPAVFFEGGDNEAQELRVPQRAGRLPEIVTWTFVTDVVLRALSPALVARFKDPLAAFARATFPSLPPFEEWKVDITLSQGRIVRRRPSGACPPSPDRPWDFLTGMVPLGRAEDSEEYGSNTLVVFLGPARAHRYLAVPSSAPPETERYTYEFGIGPARDARRALTAKMNRDDAAIWSSRG